MTTNDDLFEQFLIRCEPEMSSSAERHWRLRTKLIKFFGCRRCEDPEGLADETSGRLVTIAYAGEILHNPSGFALGTALNVYRENVRRSARLKQLDADAEAAIEKQRPTAAPDQFDDECAELCLQTLTHDKRLLLEQYYSEAGDRDELARRVVVSLAGLRTKIHRVKAELRKCYRECTRGRSN